MFLISSFINDSSYIDVTLSSYSKSLLKFVYIGIVHSFLILLR